MKIKDRYEKVIEYFVDTMPVAETELKYANPYELIVAVILSAQCTDKRVNLITPHFLKRFPDPGALSEAHRDEVYELIKSCSYPNNKTTHLLGMARMLMEKYDGRIPEDRESLMELPGVGRKTANVILSVAFNKPAMAVDTHVFRVAARIGLTPKARTPFETEEQLVRYIPEKYIPLAHHWLILHGRYVCHARKPECSRCGIKSLCAYYGRNGIQDHGRNRQKRTPG